MNAGQRRLLALQKAVREMPSRELVSFWNVLQFNRRGGKADPVKVVVVDRELMAREIPHRLDRLTTLSQEQTI